MNSWNIPKQILGLFFVYIGAIILFTGIYYWIYYHNKRSFIIQSENFQRELLLADSLTKATEESILIAQEEKANNTIRKYKNYYSLYNAILLDSSQLVKKHGNGIPKSLYFSDVNSIPSRINKYVGWINSDGNPNYIFFPEYEGLKFNYSLIIKDDDINAERRVIVKSIQVHFTIKNKNNTSNIQRDKFLYPVTKPNTHFKEFHNDIIESRIQNLKNIINQEEQELDSVRNQLKTFRNNPKKHLENLRLWDLFYFSTNIQTTGDFIDIIPNSMSVRIAIAAQRILNVIILSLVFVHYLDSRKKNN